MQGARSRAPFLAVIFAVFCSFLLTACQDIFQPKGKNPSEVSRSLALLLPASGSHAAIASKIMQGAQAAKKELEGKGVQLELAFIDTNKPDWLTKLRALPERFVMLGGPLEPTVYNQLKQSGLLEQKVLFAFLNNLNAQDEGRLAWRFFPSPRDQVDALVSFSQDRLGIRSFGAFSASDTYSNKMVQLFEKALKSRSLPLQKATYQGSDATTLARQAKNLINPTESGEGSSATPIPQTAFEAVFLPASWRQLNAILDAFLYNGEDRLVLLGTMLWEQSLTGKRLNNAEKYELAVFPVAWNTQANIPALQRIGRDFWTALGYDFLHFAMNCGIGVKKTPAEITAKANRAASVLRVLAPLHWDSEGVAHQRLFIYRATAQGMTRLDTQIFSQIREKRKETAALRMQGGLPEAMPEQQVPPVSLPEESGLPSLVTPAQAAPLPQTTPSGPPNSSYKLRLPTKSAR